MPATILDGAAQTSRVTTEVAAGVRRLASLGRTPCLAAVQANTDPGSDWYAAAQEKHCRALGVSFRRVALPPDTPEAALAAELNRLSRDDTVSGIILLTPLPPGCNYARLADEISPAKDAEGVHPANLGRLLAGPGRGPVPCTAQAALDLVKAARPDLAGARALVIGRSPTVGKPLALLLIAEHATVTVAHTRSDLASLIPEAEIVVAAAGASGAAWRSYERRWLAWRKGGNESGNGVGGARPPAPNLAPLVTLDLVRRGAVVIDVGDNHIPVSLDEGGGCALDESGRPAMRYAGDVDFARVAEVAGFITKPRGSVGPLTNAHLLRNVVRAALAAAGLEANGEANALPKHINQGTA